MSGKLFINVSAAQDKKRKIKGVSFYDKNWFWL